MSIQGSYPNKYYLQTCTESSCIHSEQTRFLIERSIDKIHRQVTNAVSWFTLSQNSSTAEMDTRASQLRKEHEHLIYLSPGMNLQKVKVTPSCNQPTPTISHLAGNQFMLWKPTHMRDFKPLCHPYCSAHSAVDHFALILMIILCTSPSPKRNANGKWWSLGLVLLIPAFAFPGRFFPLVVVN